MSTAAPTPAARIAVVRMRWSRDREVSANAHTKNAGRKITLVALMSPVTVSSTAEIAMRLSSSITAAQIIVAACQPSEYNDVPYGHSTVAPPSRNDSQIAAIGGVPSATAAR